MESPGRKTISQSFLLGGVSGTLSSVLLQPLDMIKTRQQALPRINLFKHCSLILRHEGFFAFWKGLVPTLARTVPGVGVYFSSLQFLQFRLLGDTPPSSIQSLALGSGARSTAGVLLIPFTVIKTRVESGLFNYTGVLHALRTLHAQEGLRGLTSGILPTLLRDVPFSGLYLMFYTQLKSRLKSADLENAGNPIRKIFESSELRNFGCGLWAGALACLVTHPVDVIKTKIQVSTSVLKSGNVVADIFRNDGIGGFFHGLTPRLLRRSLMAAISWSVYENLSVYIQR